LQAEISMTVNGDFQVKLVVLDCRYSRGWCLRDGSFTPGSLWVAKLWRLT